MPKAARLSDRGRHDKDDLTAVEGSPDVFINGQPAVRKGDMYQPKNHPASQGSATVNINGKPAVRVGDSIAGHATASSGSHNVIIGDASYGAGGDNARPVYKILLSQVPGSAAPQHVYAEYPYALYHDDTLVAEGLSDEKGIIEYEYEPPLKGSLRVEMASGVSFTLEVTPFAPSNTRRGTMQRMQALSYFRFTENEDDEDTSLREGTVVADGKDSPGVTEALQEYIKAKMP